MRISVHSALMQAHHAAWLKAHPDRTREWLQYHVQQGFEVHHVDCNHHNNEPANLVLIEVVDHHRLHGRNIQIPKQYHGVDLRWGELAYRARLKTQWSWEAIAERLEAKQKPLVDSARIYAIANGHKWPLPGPKAKGRKPAKRSRPVYKGEIEPSGASLAQISEWKMQRSLLDSFRTKRVKTG